MRLCSYLSVAPNASQSVMQARCMALSLARITGHAVGDQFVVYHRAVRTWERCTETLGVAGLVHYKADEVVFTPFLVKMDE